MSDRKNSGFCTVFTKKAGENIDSSLFDRSRRIARRKVSADAVAERSSMFDEIRQTIEDNSAKRQAKLDVLNANIAEMEDAMNRGDIEAAKKANAKLPVSKLDNK